MYKPLFIAVFILSFRIISAQSIAEIAENIMFRDSIPEMAYAVVTKDSVFIKNVLGHHQITEWNEKQNANLNDYFHLGSNTKAITGFVAAYLVENQKIKWDTKLFDVFPDLKDKSNPSYYHVTLEDLLSHRAKIQPFTSGDESVNCPRFTGDKQEKRAKLAECVLMLQPVESDKNWNYSNAGVVIAACMLEKVCGKSWEKLVTEILKEKSEIDLVFGWPHRNFRNQPLGHWIRNGKLVPVPPNIKYDLSALEPAGDISMNIGNFAKFIQLNIKGLAGEDNILKAEMYQFLHTAKDEYAIGWVNDTKDGKQISWHNGSAGTFYSLAHIDREKSIGYIILVNSGSKTAIEGVHEMLKKLIILPRIQKKIDSDACS